MVHNNAKPDIVVEVVGLIVVAVGDARVPLIVVPRAAAQRLRPGPNRIML
jgi:hypothetical protein